MADDIDGLDEEIRRKLTKSLDDARHGRLLTYEEMFGEKPPVYAMKCKRCNLNTRLNRQGYCYSCIGYIMCWYGEDCNVIEEIIERYERIVIEKLEHRIAEEGVK